MNKGILGVVFLSSFTVSAQSDPIDKFVAMYEMATSICETALIKGKSKNPDGTVDRSSIYCGEWGELNDVLKVKVKRSDKKTKQYLLEVQGISLDTLISAKNF